ncbi:hypothetical protein ABT340_15595 [Streptosporangium sp. NPDC000239]|uniref:hypothetical protein n=1 Tax=Streptosporangium sp. NPDC000239 TaxID=3154248 RepID=UPI00331BD69D
MTGGCFPTEIYFVTGIRPRGQIFHLTGPMRQSIKGYAGRGRNVKGVKIWKLNPPGWRDVSQDYVDEKGYLKW